MANSSKPTQTNAESDMANHQQQAVAARWPDFYSLLEVPPNADDETLKKRIREAYMEATANSDHRNIARRIHYQTMVERIVPQARRVLLDPTLRAEYDKQRELHAKGDAAARDYADFLREVPGSGAFGSNPTSAVSVPGRASSTPSFESATSTAGNFGDASFGDEGASTFWSDMALREDSEPLNSEKGAGDASTVEFDRTSKEPEIPVVETPVATLPLEALPSVDSLPVPETPQRIETVQHTEVTPVQVTPVATVPSAVVPPTVSTPEATAVAAPQVEAATVSSSATPIPEQPKPPAADAEIRAKTVSAAEAAALADANSTIITPEVMRRGRPRGDYVSPLMRKVGGESNTRRIFSHTAQMLLAAIAAAGLTIFILRANQAPSKIPLRIVYAPGLQGVMEAERVRFAKTPAGGAVELLMQPLDGRAAMQAALAPGFGADIWIPSEGLWSDRYSDVAGSKNAKPLTQARSLALSPSVLVARADRAAALRRRFPNRTIPSWEALRAAVIADAPGHFGLGDPVRSGSGSIARYFMAKEWSARNGRELSPQTARDTNLWRWLGGFEDNIPVAERLSSDMVKDLALGTGGRYWWAIALESEAIGWIQKGKDLEIFYLPQTNYADHPLCAWERGGNSGGARGAFDSLLRSPEAQTTFLKNGYRPTGIELSTRVAGNPFTDPKLRARGLRREGFRVIERIPYRIVNQLNGAWSERYN
ncbi:MAG TPA: substrate-binding domain-containing protein [Abditibacteriaceae bacterium]|jgi:hypothetical protein